MGGSQDRVSHPTAATGLGRGAISPGHVHCGDVELDPFEPQHHEQALAEGAVSDVFSIQTGLSGKQRNEDLTHCLCSPSPDRMPGSGEPPSRSREEGTWRAWPSTGGSAVGSPPRAVALLPLESIRQCP